MKELNPYKTYSTAHIKRLIKIGKLKEVTYRTAPWDTVYRDAAVRRGLDIVITNCGDPWDQGDEVIFCILKHNDIFQRTFFKAVDKVL